MITFAVAPLTGTFLVSIRLGTIILLSPVEAIRQLPVHARLLLVLVSSLLIAANAPQSTQAWHEISLVAGSLAEFGNGLIFSVGLSATFALFQIAGQLIDTQMGLNSLSILNPADHSHDPLSGRLLMMLAVLFFFSLDGHLKLLQVITVSFSVIAPGQLVLFYGFEHIIKQFTLMFTMAFMIAFPVIASLMLVDFIGALLTRNMPQISTYFLTLPLKIMLGLFVFYILLNWINPVMDNIFQIFFSSLTRVAS